jgi:signal transduction histidine kinase/putative methionine-R-sulfoxide reductase with GAF domain
MVRLPGAPVSLAADSTANGAEDVQQRLRVEQRKVDAVRQLGRIFGATLDLDRLLVVLLEKVTDLLDAERATIFLVSDDGQALESKIVQGGALATTIRLRRGEGIAGAVAQSGETLNIPDAYADPRFNQTFDQKSGFRTRSILCMPMPDHKGGILGVMQLLNKRLGTFSGDDEALLATVAAHAGIAIENSKLYRSVLGKNSALLRTQNELRQRIAELDLLFELESEASAAFDLDELLARLLTRAIELVGVEAGSILLRDRGGELFFLTAQGPHAEGLQKLKLPAGEGIVGWVALHRLPLMVNDPDHDARHDLFIPEKIGVPARNILAVPLMPARTRGATEEGSLGAIELLNKRSSGSGTGNGSGNGAGNGAANSSSDGFDEADMRLLTLIAGQASRAITITRNREERLLSERLASIGQMMSGVLHDIRTPMTIVSGYAQLMATSEDQKQRTHHAELILKQLDLMSAMTRELLQFARGESNLYVRKVYLQLWLPELCQQLERELAGKDVELVVDARYKGLAYFDENKMFRVISNLARNAAQAMAAQATAAQAMAAQATAGVSGADGKNGGGRFTITVEEEDPELILTFSDTGPGIPEAMLGGRLFQAFATSGKPDGTGLGLAIVKKIVDEHQGRISYTTSSAGTHFRVALPLHHHGS